MQVVQETITLSKVCVCVCSFYKKALDILDNQAKDNSSKFMFENSIEHVILLKYQIEP